MENRIVSYTQALDLKGLGFSEECLYHYKYRKLLPNEYMNDPGYYYIPLKDHYKSINRECPGENNICDAPFLWQVQEWLISKGLLIVIYSMSFESWQYRICRKGQKFMDSELYEDFESYQDALSDGITECLKILSE